jgi:hypothetical protein
MKRSDWNDPRIRAIGRRYAAEAYDLASELDNYGADAAELIKPRGDEDPNRPRSIAIPTMFADALMALLLSLPRPEWAPDRDLGGNVVVFKTPRSPAPAARP